MSSRFTFTITGTIDVDDPARLATSVGQVRSLGADGHTHVHGADAQLALQALLGSGLSRALDREAVGEYDVHSLTIDVHPSLGNGMS